MVAHGTWTQISGGAKQPVTVTNGSLPTASTITVTDANNALWAYNSGTWTQYTNGSANQPTVNSVVSYDSNRTQFVVLDVDGNIWLYK